MAYEEHVAVVLQGVKVWNEWRAEKPKNFQADLSNYDFSNYELRGADLSGANLFGSHFENADLSDANLSGANLRYARLYSVALVRTNFRGADLTFATLDDVDLEEAKLSEAHLTSVQIIDANLKDTDFSGAFVGATVFGRIDLRGAKNLDTLQHSGPSVIGIDTVYASMGQIPRHFLRDAGVDDGFITYISSLVGRATQFYSCFISYSTKDHDFASRLHADLEDHNVRCWFAEHDMHGGRTVDEQIDRAIRLHDRVLLIVSPASMESTWVNREIMKACKRGEKEKRRVLFPIGLVEFRRIQAWESLDADTGIDYARKVREYYIPDFSRWKQHDDYQRAFQRLLRDLRANSHMQHASAGA
jgi:uncharacterized protein YjbI with pentapeptide repeats